MNYLRDVKAARKLARNWPKEPSNVHYLAAQELLLSLRCAMMAPAEHRVPTRELSRGAKKLARQQIETTSTAIRELEAAIGMK